MPFIRLLVPLLLLALFAACQPDLGECDPVGARAVVYDPAGQPAYAGQALMEVGCAASGNYCHAPGAQGQTRFGAPAGYDLDVRRADGSELERLRDSHERVLREASRLWAEIHSGRMPPPEPARSEALGGTTPYVQEGGEALPAIGSPEASAILRNWLACDAPVVEATSGTATLGDIVPPRGLACPPGQAECTVGVCQDILDDPRHCGECGNDCGAFFCFDGGCVETCPEGTRMCGSSCVQPDTSQNHCGGCDMPCRGDQRCNGGACVCLEGLTDCGAECIDVLGADRDNCGGCGVTCAAGESCEAGTCVACGPAATLSGDIQPIFTRSCAVTGCHTGVRPSAGLSLTSGSSHAALVNVPSSAAACSSQIRVVPLDPERSYLVKKLRGSAECGVQMPRRNEMLSGSELELIRGWICRGAAND